MFFGDFPPPPSSKQVDTSNFYQILEIDKDASPTEIKKAYRKLAVKYHPDKGGDPERFKEITRAYEVLSDQEKRVVYDKHGEEGLEGNGGDPSDIFAGLFGGGGCGGGGSGNIGFSSGGAQDIGNFRETIAAKRMPRLSSFTVEGLFSEYFFETGNEWHDAEVAPKKLFWTAYSFACSPDPLATASAANDELWMAVGLNSGIREQDFQRKNLNLALIIDVSGSMSQSFRLSSPSSKLDIAKEAASGLLCQLRPEDRLAIVLFDDDTEVLQPLSLLADLNVPDLQAKLQDVHTRGGTNMERGFSEGLRQLKSMARNVDPNVEESRVIFLTDDMPNCGCTSGEGMLDLVRSAAESGIYTSLLGVGLDFNPDVVEAMSKAKGAWYGSVKSAEEFRRCLAEEFDYMVTPLVFNLRLHLSSDFYAIDRVLGSPEANAATEQLMRVNTLFPSPKDSEGRTKGGVVLVRLVRKQTSAEAPITTNNTMKLRVFWEDRAGVPDFHEQLVVPPVSDLGETGTEGCYHESPGVRKAVLLARYASVVRQWLWDETCNLIEGVPICMNLSRGIFREPLVEQVSTVSDESHNPTLRVSEYYRSVFEKLKLHMEREVAVLGDESIRPEVEVLEALLRVGESDP